jgi:SET and MYND domain-containing protein
MAVCIVENIQLEKSAEVLALLFKLANIISVNAFTIQDYLFNYEGIAIGLYHPANYINHSCSPNAVQLFDGKTLKIIALQDIAEDEEIFISYLDELNDQPTRNKMLRETYLFDCGCFHCLAEKAVKTNSYALICQQCGNGALKQSPTTKLYECGECKK